MKLSDKNEKLTIENWQKTQLNPFHVHADLEAIDVASDGAGKTNNPKTIEIQRQNAGSSGANMVNFNCECFA